MFSHLVPGQGRAVSPDSAGDTVRSDSVCLVFRLDLALRMLGGEKKWLYV